ncbi:unnamed protein product [Mytilus coruscus]|uniref:HEPN domain-containing protein n=1 Tax=Mytilus coruscus TaxID=42192 RepID=A0A6J8C5A5_MYTCO|nr:unnamed protein product [Mytilus coruscus]
MVKGNRTLCILDPLCKYATAADKRKPGSRYYDLDDLEDIVPDVFVPYHEEQLMGDEGTIFRFPLRKTPSEIWDKPIDTEHLTSLLGQFKTEASRSLFFLNHIHKVLFSSVENGQIINEYSITIKMSPGDDTQKREFHKKRQKFAEIIKNKTQITTEPVLQIQTKMTLLVFDKNNQNLEPDEETWFVVERIGFNEGDVPKDVYHAYSAGKLGLLPQGGVAVPLSNVEQLQFSAFCVLPLPIKTGLPMNVNGHFALNHEARRNLWEDNKESLQVTWNRTLMSSVVAPSYIAAIEKQRDICKESTHTWNSEHYVRKQLTKYFKYFPSVNKAEDANWKYMCTEVYRQIAEGTCLFPTISTEIRTINSIFPISTFKVAWICLKKKDSEFQSVFCLEDKHSVDPYSVVSIMKLLNLQVIDLSSNLYEDMKACRIKVESVTPDIVTIFLQSHSNVNSDSCKIVGLGNDIQISTFKTIWNVEKLLMYCKKSKSFNQQLPNLPLCISNDNILMAFSETRPMYVTKHCNIMHGLEAKFINKNLYYTMKDINSSCLKKFTLQDFDILIKHVLSPRSYRDSVTSFTWNPEQKKLPNQDWLRDVWNFFADVTAIDNSEKEETYHSVIHTLSTWYLLPVRKGHQQELHRIGMSKYILLGESFITNKPLFDALKNIEMPELDSNILLRRNTSPIQKQYVEAAYKKAEKMVVSYGNLSGVFECFVYNLKQYEKVISEDDCCAILEYFNDNFSTLEEFFSTSEIVQKLRSIPLFITLSGYNRNISNSNTKVIVVSTNIPDCGIKEWATASDIVLLTENTRIKPLYMKLGFNHCNASELYSKYIILKFHNMPQEAQLEHLKYIRDNLLLQGIDREFNCVQEEMIEKLSKCPFLRKNSTFVCAEEFCSPRNYLFSVMCSEDEFPPHPYNIKVWDNFMELIGMKMEPSPEMVLRFAKTISEEGLQSLSEETEFKSSLLLQHLLTRSTLLEELKCAPFSSIRSIRFIKPFELDISNCLLHIHKQYLNRGLVSFEDCTLFNKDVLPLVWTSTHVLPDYVTFNTEDRKDVLKYLGVHDLPTIEHVVKNLQHIAGSIHDKCSNESSFVTEDVALFLKDLFLKHYTFVEKNGLAHKCLMDLKATPIVFYNEEKICLLCDQVVLLLQDHEIIKPYIMRIPAEYLCCTKLFRSLGAQETTLPYHFAEVLRCLHCISCEENSQPSILGPNEKKDILVPAVRNLFLKIRSEYHIGLNITELYLPNREFILHLSKTLIVSDNNKLEKRANYFNNERFFAGLEKLNLQLEFSAYILKLLPNEIKPKFLSEILKEKLLKALECQAGDKIQMLSQFVKTPEFIEGLLRLVFDEKLKQTSQFGMDTRACHLNEQEQSRILKQIGKIKFKQVSGLETALFFEGQQLEESTEMKKAFVKSDMIGDTKSWIMYCVDNGSDLQEWLNNIQLAFVKLLEKITKRGLHKNQVYVHTLLHSISNPDLISDKLDNEEIVQLHYANVSTDIYPDPGTFVPLSLHYLLDNSFSDFKVNDYVAMLLYEEEENNTGQFTDANYLYAKVLKCIDDSQNDIAQFEQVYLLDIGEIEAKKVPAFKIFKFHRRRASKSKDIVPSDNTFNSDDSQTLDELLKDVKKQFIMIIKITDETKRRLLIRRLRAKWHPDQNFGNEKNTTIIFQFIESLISDLKDGKLIDKDFNEQSRYRGEDLPKSPYYATPPQYYQNNTQSHSTFTHGENREKVSIPRVARKWLRQAECDRDAAEALHPKATPIPAFNWICYQCHQSAEKALKAMWYNEDANNVFNSHDLSSIAIGLPQELTDLAEDMSAEKALKAMWYNEDANNVFNSHDLSSIAIGLPQELTDLAEDMVRIVGHHTRMRYPNQMSGDDIPSTIYSKHDADQCLMIASRIISFVSHRIRET